MTFPQIPLTRVMQMYIDGEWVNYTSKIVGPQGEEGPVTVGQRGRRDEQSQAQNTPLNVLLDNSGLDFSNLSPTSPNYRLLNRNTPVRYGFQRTGDSGPATVTDTFTRSFTYGWGESNTGHDWFSFSGDLFQNANVTGSAGTVVIGGTGTNRDMLVNQKFADVDVVLDWSVVTPTGARVEPAIILRAIDGDNYIMVRINVNTDNTLDLTARIRFGGIERELSLVDITDRFYSTGATWKLRARIEGTLLQARLWDSALTEPSTWDLDIPQCGLVGEGWTGVRSGVASGNTSFPHTFTYTNFSATAISGTTHWRFHGEISDIRPSSDITGRVKQARMTAAGPLRRLAQGSKALGSPMKRAVLAAENRSTVVAYWPVEEGSNSTTITSATGAADGVIVGDVELGAYTASPAADALAVLDSGRLVFNTPAYSSTQHKIASLWAFPTGGTVSTGDTIMRIQGIGTLAYIDIDYQVGGSLNLIAVSTSGVTTSSGPTAFGVDSEHFYMTVELTQDGSDIDYVILVSHIDINTSVGALNWSGTISNVTCTRIATVTANPLGELANDTVAFGQLVVANSTGALPNVQATGTGVSALVAHTGERAGARFQRLCIEEGLSAEIIGYPENTEQMGPQRNNTLFANLSECEAADRGIMFDSRKAFAPAYRTNLSMENQYPALTINYDDADLSPPFGPAYDDASIWNDVTFTRTDGGSVRAFDEDGPLSILEPPAGVGTYDRGPQNVNVYTDAQLGRLAGRVMRIGTVDSIRIPEASIELARGNWSSSADMIRATNLEVGDMVRMTMLPDWLGPAGSADFSDQYLLSLGYNESGHQKGMKLNYNFVAGDAWETEMIEIDDSSIAIGYDETDTSLLAAIALGPSFDTDNEPYLLEIVDTGEVIRVTNVANPVPVYQGEGTISHGNNASNTPTLPGGMQDGWAMICVAAIRNSGTGTVNTPGGWRKLVDFGNVAILGAHYDLEFGESTQPTITYAGGVANATTTAQIFAFSGMSLEFGGGTKATPAAATLLNASAANVTTPALEVVRGLSTVLSFIWKQDDWTSVANNLGFTEVMDDFSILGDDQGTGLAYSIQGSTPSNIAASTWTVTGGLAAISRAITVAFRPLQTLTVDRSVNGVVAEIPPGAELRAWRNAYIGL